MLNDRGSSMRDARGRPSRGGRAKQFHLRIDNLPEVVMGGKRSGLTEQRLVPFEAARDIGHPYDRPGALHQLPHSELILSTWWIDRVPELTLCCLMHSSTRRFVINILPATGRPFRRNRLPLNIPLRGYYLSDFMSDDGTRTDMV